jgi:hypothetical protein
MVIIAARTPSDGRSVHFSLKHPRN